MDSHIITMAMQVILLITIIPGSLALPHRICPNQNYEAGSRLRYLFSSSVEQETTFMGFQCTLDITTSPQCITAIEFSACQPMGSGANNFQQTFLHTTKAQLESFPTLVKFSANDATDIQVDNRESVGTLNVKRSVLMALQSWDLPTGYHTRQHSTVLGSCTTEITVTEDQTKAEIKPKTCDPATIGLHPLIDAVTRPQAGTAAAAAAQAEIVSSECEQQTGGTHSALSFSRCEHVYTAAASSDDNRNNHSRRRTTAPPSGKLSIYLQLETYGSASSYPTLSTPSHFITLPYTEASKMPIYKPDESNTIVKSPHGVLGGVTHWFTGLWHRLTGSHIDLAASSMYKHALLFSDSRIYTFDGHVFQMQAPTSGSGSDCTYLLTRDIVHHNLSILSSSDHTVTIITSELSVTIENTGRVTINNSALYSDLPAHSWNDAVSISRSGDVISFTSVYGVTVTYHVTQHVYTFSLAARYYGNNIQGLLGNLDDNADNDEYTRAGVAASTLAEFLQSYEISGRRECRGHQSETSGNSRGGVSTGRQNRRRWSGVCSIAFQSSSSSSSSLSSPSSLSVAACSQIVDMQPFIDACETSSHVNPIRATCEAMAAYQSLCSARGVLMPGLHQQCY